VKERGEVEFSLLIENAKKHFHENIGVIILRNPWH
jgi:hypothetical protein